jgi:hypothetical protein
LALRGRVAGVVVLAPLDGVAKDLVRPVDLLHPACGVVGRVLVRMVFERESAEGGLDYFDFGVWRDL